MGADDGAGPPCVHGRCRASDRRRHLPCIAVCAGAGLLCPPRLDLFRRAIDRATSSRRVRQHGRSVPSLGRTAHQNLKDPSYGPAVRQAPVSAAQTLADDAANNGGALAEEPDYQGSFGRTLFDDRASEDGTVTVVFPPERIGDIPSQSLIRIVSKPDRHEYIASLTAAGHPPG